MRAYTEYSQIDAKWLGVIPSHWDCKKIGTLFSQRKEKVSDKDFAPLSVTKNGILPQLSNAAKSNDGDNRKLVRTGDFVINSRSDRKGSCGVSSSDGSVSLINIVLTPRQDLNSRYVHYLLRSQPFSEEYYRYGRGIVADLWTTRYSEMKNIYIPIPPRSEQDQIVRYLDWQVSKINKLIAAKKKQIVFLKECRKAVIDTAILHGMNKHTEEKDSGVYWLGRIPASWEVLPLRRICSINASISHLIKKLPSDELVVFLPMESVSTEGIVDCSQKKPLHEVRTGYSSFARNDVVVAKITPCFENGKGACLDKLDTEIGFGTTEFINIRASEKVLPQYLYYITITQPFRILGAEVMTGSAGQKRISTDFIKNFTLGIPDIKEQQELLNILNDNLLKIDNAIQLVASTIDTLHEYRNRLISDVVTGQIDVRDIVIPEYEHVEEEPDEESDDIESVEEETEEQEEN
jgi:type I restriction enzyme S subunit